MANAVRRGSSDAGSSRNRFLGGLAALVLTLSAFATFTAVAYAAPEWDDVRVNSVNRLPARCDAFPLANAAGGGGDGDRIGGDLSLWDRRDLL